MNPTVTKTDRLFSEHRQGVFRYLCRLVGQSEPARDLTQEVFLRVTRAGVPDTDAGGERAWVFSVARNLGLNFLRDGARRPATGPMVERAAAPTQELAVALNQALEALADLDRDVFLMREVGGLNYDEIAVACDLTPAAVRSRLHRARQELRATLAPALRRTP
ncbi:MAG: RNA polymerase sigma factor [Acidobacteria bacterium]|nr:RNA polymerase sigma factor [Acidobacteriota bacterium]